MKADGLHRRGAGAQSRNRSEEEHYEKSGIYLAARVAGELADQGIGCIELCGGFGIKGMYLVKEAVGDRAQIGAVRFDAHPGLNFESGDKRFDQ